MFVLHVKSEHNSNVKKSTTYDRLLDEFMPKKMINNKVSEIIKKHFEKPQVRDLFLIEICTTYLLSHF